MNIRLDINAAIVKAAYREAGKFLRMHVLKSVGATSTDRVHGSPKRRRLVWRGKDAIVERISKK